MGTPAGFLPMTWSDWNQIADPPPRQFDAETHFKHKFFSAQQWITVEFAAAPSWVRSAFLASASQADQDQLLQHEQYHLLLAGALAAKAITAMQSGGSRPSTASARN